MGLFWRPFRPKSTYRGRSFSCRKTYTQVVIIALLTLSRQSNRHVLQHAAPQSVVPGLQPPSPPVVTLLPAPQASPPGPDPPPVAAPLPELMLPQSDRKLEEVPLGAQTFIQNIRQVCISIMLTTCQV